MASNSNWMKERWKDPVYRAHMSERNRVTAQNCWADPEYRKRASKRMSEIAIQFWKDPERRLKKTLISEETREKMRKSHLGKTVSKEVLSSCRQVGTYQNPCQKSAGDEG